MRCVNRFVVGFLANTLTAITRTIVYSQKYRFDLRRYHAGWAWVCNISRAWRPFIDETVWGFYFCVEEKIDRARIEIARWNQDELESGNAE